MMQKTRNKSSSDECPRRPPSRQPPAPGGMGVSMEHLHEEEIESRYEAKLGVALVIVLQVTLALVSLGGGWTLIGLSG
jgi:hypothetical protein